MRRESTEFHQQIEAFLRQYGKGTLVGNDAFNRYLSDAARVRCANSLQTVRRHPDIVVRVLGGQ